MRNLLFQTILMFLTLLCIISCSPNNSTIPQFTVKYTNLNQYEGDTLYLWYTSGDAMWRFSDTSRGVLDSAIVTNGTATFTGPEDTLFFYVIDAGIERIKFNPDTHDLTINNATKIDPVAFIPERGELTLIPPPPGEFGMKGEFTYQSTNPQSKNIAFYDLRQNKKYPVKETRKMLFDNINNALGGQLLNGYAILYPDELEWIYEHTNEQFLNNPYTFYGLKNIIHNTHQINPGDLFINFRQKEYFRNDTIEFANIAGHGKPVCLLFPLNMDEKNRVRNEMEVIRSQYPHISFVVPGFYYADPRINEFYKELQTRYGAIILDDSRKFDGSVRWNYRLWSGINYSCIFDGEGKLLTKKVLQYEDYDTFKMKFYDLMQTWKQAPLSLSSKSSDYLSVPGYAEFKQYVLNNPEGISMLLDYTLYDDETFGLRAYMVDDIVRAKYKEAPAIQDYIHSGQVKQQDLLGLVNDYVNKVRLIAGYDFGSH